MLVRFERTVKVCVIVIYIVDNDFWLAFPVDISI